MQVHDKTLTFDKTLWVRYGAVGVQQQGDTVTVTGRDDDSYIKIFNHFGRVLKLYTFEQGHWVDADTGMAAAAFDDSQAGRLPEEVVAVRAAAVAKGAAGQKTASARRGGTKAKPTTRKATRTATRTRSNSTSGRQTQNAKSSGGKAAGSSRRSAARSPKGGLKRAGRG